MVIKHSKNFSLKMRCFLMGISLLTKVSNQTLWFFAQKQKTKALKTSNHQKYSVTKIQGIEVIKTMSEVNSNSFVIYFHGGGFVMPGSQHHLYFITKLAKASKLTCYYIEYPLAPDHQAVETIKSLESVIQKIHSLEENKEMIFIGDSAGGNLALVLAKRLSNVKQLFLLSPWLDLTLKNPEIDLMQQSEMMFTKQQLAVAAKSYQGELPLNDLMISPYYDDFSHQAMTIFAGTNDLLFPDILAFALKYQHIDLHQYEGLPHDFMFFARGREQKQVIESIIKDLNKPVDDLKEAS